MKFWPFREYLIVVLYDKIYLSPSCLSSSSIETAEDALQSRIRELSRLPEHDDPPGYKAGQSENYHERQTSRGAPSET